MALVGQNSRVCHHGDENENVKNQLVKREFKIPRLGRLQKRRLKSDFTNYETLVRLSQLGHNVLSLVSIWSLRSLRSLKKSSAVAAIIWKPLFTAIAAIAEVLRCIAYVHAFQDGCQLASSSPLGKFRAEERLRQKFHTDDANQCLHNKSGSHGARGSKYKFVQFYVSSGRFW